MRFTLNQVVEVVIGSSNLRPNLHGTVRARLQHLQRLDFPEGIKGTAPGRRANYDEDRLIKVAFALELLDLGFTPARMKATVARHWPEVREAIAVAAADQSEAVYIATHPGALSGLRRPEDADEVAWVHSGLTLRQLSALFARTVTSAPNFAAINLTGLVFDVARAVKNLLRADDGANEFLTALRSWKRKP